MTNWKKCDTIKVQKGRGKPKPLNNLISEVVTMRMYKRLEDCYKNPSQAKMRIYRACVSKAINDNAIVYGIETFNQQIFTFGYETIDGRYVHITPKNFFNLCRNYY